MPTRYGCWAHAHGECQRERDRSDDESSGRRVFSVVMFTLPVSCLHMSDSSILTDANLNNTKMNEAAQVHLHGLGHEILG